MHTTVNKQAYENQVGLYAGNSKQTGLCKQKG